MTGQGSPILGRLSLFARARQLSLLSVALAMALSCCASTLAAAESSLRLRFAWGGGGEKTWHGKVQLQGGAASELKPLGIEADESGTLWIDSDDPSVIHIRERSPRAYDGFDVLVTANLQDSIRVELEAVADAGPEEHGSRPAAVPTTSLAIPLADLVDSSKKTQLDATGNRLLVMRSPGDKMRVRFERDHLVFAPRDTLPLEIAPHLLGLPAGTPLTVKAQLVQAHVTGEIKERLWSREWDTTTPQEDDSSEPQAVDVELPEAEGVYNLSIAAIQPGLSERLPWSKPLVERIVQVVVLDPKRSAATDAEPAEMNRLLEIDPAHPRWYDRLANLPLVPGQRRGPLGSGVATRWQHPTLGAMMQLGQAKGGGETTDDEPAWQAYPLPLGNPGQPHILEVEYPSDVPQSLGISIIEPNAAGAVMPIGLDSGVYVAATEADAPPRMLRHRVAFWPRTRSPMLLVTQLGATTPSVYGRIRVLGTLQSQLPTFGIGSKSQPRMTLPRLAPAERNADGANRRLICGYLDRPLFVENFAAPEAMDLFSRRSLDDWTTFYLGAQRLVEYSNHVGYGGMVMSVLADGSTIYPSARIEPTPKHDTGVFFATGQDAVRKDVLELAFQMFDREALMLIPAVHFSAPLVELEQLRREAPQGATGIDLIGADGRSYVERYGSKQGLAPFYNPLDPRVQTAMLGVVKELAERYADHASYGGLAVVLSADGYAQLPGAEWGCDDATIERFVEESRAAAGHRSELTGNGNKRFAARAELLRGKLKSAWLDWRAGQMTAFYGRLKSACGGNLLLLEATAFDTPGIAKLMTPALPRRTGMEDAMLAQGLRAKGYGRESEVLLPRPYRVGPPLPVVRRGVDEELNRAADAEQWFAESAADDRSTCFYHEPVRTRLASFDEQSPFGKANTYTWLVSQLSPSGDRNRQRFVHALAARDARLMIDGGWLLPLGQEGAVAGLIATVQQLPVAIFDTLAEPSEPVTIRTLVEDRQTYAYFVNDSPWPVRLEVTIDAEQAVRVERIGPGKKLPAMVRGPGSNLKWLLAFQPYELMAVRFDDARVRLSGPRVTIDEANQLALAKRIGDLSARVAALASPDPLPVLMNPGFEAEPDGGQLPGWTLGTPARTEGGLATTVSRGGRRSLRLSSNGPQASVRSDAIDPPGTGRLSVALWLKVADKRQQPAVRLSVEGRSDDAEYFRFATVGGSGAGQVALEENWTQYIYQVDDLPTGGLRDLRVRFDLMGVGEIWIDDVQVYDLAFSQNERVELSKLVSLADYRRNAGEYSGCLQLLESYWPQFLVEHVPQPSGAGSMARRPLPQRKQVLPDKPPTESPRTPGMFDRLKGFVPRFSSGE